MLALLILIAQAAADPNETLKIVLPWTTAFVVAILGGVGIHRARNGRLKLRDPLNVQATYGPPSLDMHNALVLRVAVLERHSEECRQERAHQFVKLLETGQAREDRLVATMNAGFREVHARVDALKDRTPPRRQG